MASAERQASDTACFDGEGWSRARAQPRLWGHSVPSLVQAWWRSQGVEWIPRGSGPSVLPAADLYLLTDPSQLVAFELAPLVHALVWNRPSLSRICVVSTEEDQYRERVVLDSKGIFLGIRREYSHEIRGSQRVLMTSNASIARLWATAATRRQAFRSVRKTGVFQRSDRHQVKGELAVLGDQAREGQILTWLVERWQDPGRVLQGISELRPRVWAADGTALSDRDIVVGPVWIGDAPSGRDSWCLVGPHWEPDLVASGSKVLIRPMSELYAARPREARRPSEPLSLYSCVKRVIDIAFSATALLLLSPLLLLIALLVLMDDGWPVIFGHERQTRGGALFRCLKFRTMRRDAEQIVAQLQASNVCDGPQVYLEVDPRITRVGAVLRRYHLDELLQLVNVLRGQMSLVGPRPSPERENRLCPAWREARLSVRPGITGLWQVMRTRQRGLDFQEWIRFDMDYVQSRSLRLDVWIIMQTLRNLIVKETNNAPDLPRSS